MGTQYENEFDFVAHPYSGQGHRHNGRSTTAHIVFDLRSLIWIYDESCTIVVQGLNSEPEIVLRNMLYWHFLRSPTVWLQFETGEREFRPPGLGVTKDVGVGDNTVR